MKTNLTLDQGTIQFDLTISTKLRKVSREAVNTRYTYGDAPNFLFQHQATNAWYVPVRVENFDYRLVRLTGDDGDLLNIYDHRLRIIEVKDVPLCFDVYEVVED